MKNRKLRFITVVLLCLTMVIGPVGIAFGYVPTVNDEMVDVEFGETIIADVLYNDIDQDLDYLNTTIFQDPQAGNANIIGNFTIYGVSYSTQTPGPIPTGLKIASNMKVLEYDGITYWPFSYSNNSFDTMLVGYDQNGSIISQKNYSGTRYVHTINIDYNTNMVTFIGQGGNQFSKAIIDLFIDDTSKALKSTPPGDIPAGLKKTSGPSMPVLIINGIEFWPFSHIDNRLATTLIGYTPNGKIVHRSYYDGARYINNIVISKTNKTAEFFGQAYSFSVQLNDLKFLYNQIEYENTSWQPTDYLIYEVNDGNGGIEQSTLNINILDLIYPTITGYTIETPNGYGWFKDNVTVHFEATDLESGIDFITPDIIVQTEGEGQSVTGEAHDRAGNISTFTVENINLDKSMPWVNINSFDIMNGESKYLGYIATGYQKSYVYHDLLSGHYIDGALTKELIIPNLTSVAGMDQTYDLTIWDRADNEATVTFDYHVISMDDLLRLVKPLEMDGDYRTNRTIPVKLVIEDDQSTNPTITGFDNLKLDLMLKMDDVTIPIKRTNKVSEGYSPTEFLLVNDQTTFQFNLNTKGYAPGEYTLYFYIDEKIGLDEGLIGTVTFNIIGKK